MRVDIALDWRAWLVDHANQHAIHAACDAGWRGIVGDLLRLFHVGLAHARNARIRILQVKEKFAGLRVYWREENIKGEEHARPFEIYKPSRSSRTAPARRVGSRASRAGAGPSTLASAALQIIKGIYLSAIRAPIGAK